MKMIKTWFGYMTSQEAKMIGDIARDEKNKKKLKSDLFSINKVNNYDYKNGHKKSQKS